MKRINAKPSLGIMVVTNRTTIRHKPPFSDRGFYRRLSLIGYQAGIEVIIFDPLQIDWRAKRVRGYRFDAVSKAWHEVTVGIPSVIFDRCFYSGKAQFLRYKKAQQRLRLLRSDRYIAVGLSGKWQVQQLLSMRAELLDHLPETRPLTDIRQVMEWLTFRNACILKPNAGSHGKMILRIVKRSSDEFELSGRDASNRPISAIFDSERQLLRWLTRFIGSKKYLIQESLTLHTASGEPFDVRSLVQKDGHGHWKLTGMAVRVGRPGSLTANLHGGGTSWPLRQFLHEHYKRETVTTIIENLNLLSDAIPPVLERGVGGLVELGIDFGIDMNGKVWVLEVNSKPGRSVFSQLQDVRSSRASIANIIDFACYLLDRQLGGLRK